MNYKRILIIDDDYHIREVTKLTLELMAEWEVLTASSGSEGLALAQTDRPDAILLDIMMPDLDGMETLKNLRANSLTQHVPVLLLTAKAQTTEQQLFDLGVAGIISKPFDPLTLPSTIAGALSWLDDPKSEE